MKVILFFVLMLTIASASFAQTGTAKDVVIANDTSVLMKVEVESDFPGGAAAWIRFLNNNLVYPPKAVRKK